MGSDLSPRRSTSWKEQACAEQRTCGAGDPQISWHPRSDAAPRLPGVPASRLLNPVHHPQVSLRGAAGQPYTTSVNWGNKGLPLTQGPTRIPGRL